MWCNSLGWLPMAPIQMAEVQKCAPAVTADGADADPALLPIAGRTHAQITLLTGHISHAQRTHAQITLLTMYFSHEQCTLHTHRPQDTVHMHRCRDQITHSALFTLCTHMHNSSSTAPMYRQITQHKAQWSSLQTLYIT